MLSDGHIALGDTDIQELSAFVEMEQNDDTAPFIIPHSLRKHRESFSMPEVLYKSVYDRSSRLVGFVLLVLDPDGRSVEFRRIVIRDKGRGYGKRAVALVDTVCRTELGRNRLWLDVFNDNLRARHIYEKHGYRVVGTSVTRGKTLLIYEKELSS